MDRSDPAAWVFACPDWKERLHDGRSLMPALPLDQAAASRAVGIFNRLRLPDVNGQPALGEAGSDWQRDIVAALFGSVLPDGRRMVRTRVHSLRRTTFPSSGRRSLSTSSHVQLRCCSMLLISAAFTSKLPW